jgi:hypothetical protein
MTLHECSGPDMPCFCFLNFSAMQSFVAAAHHLGWEMLSGHRPPVEALPRGAARNAAAGTGIAA